MGKVKVPITNMVFTIDYFVKPFLKIRYKIVQKTDVHVITLKSMFKQIYN